LAGLEARARTLAGKLAGVGVDVEAAPAASLVGGGTCPGVELPSWSVRIRCEQLAAAEAARALRAAPTPVIARVEADRLVLDLRTVFEEEDEAVFAVLSSVLGAAAAGA
jgi:L-seryl-tRNA(Ser) seleniumtransferase